MSELMKMLNDDTTQILLAIVLGIIICWFIFGRNCGSLCNRDGFSVGGPCVNDGTAAYTGDCGYEASKKDGCGFECCEAMRGCQWAEAHTLPGAVPAPPSRSCDTAGNIANCCDEGVYDTPCTIVGVGEVDGQGDSAAKCTQNMQGETNDFYCWDDTYNQVVSHTTLQSQRHSDDRGGSSLRDICNSYPSGYVLEAGAMNPLVMACPRAMEGEQIYTVTRHPDNIRPTPPAESDKHTNILNDIKVFLLDFIHYDISDDGTLTVTYADDVETHSCNLDECTMDQLKEIAYNYGIKFTLINNDRSDTNNRLVDQINSITIGGLTLGDMFRPFIALPSTTKDEIYCDANINTLSENNIGRIDPLLKMRSYGDTGDDTVDHLPTCPVGSTTATGESTAVAVPGEATSATSLVDNFMSDTTRWGLTMTTHLETALTRGIGHVAAVGDHLRHSGTSRMEFLTNYVQNVFDSTVQNGRDQDNSQIDEHSDRDYIIHTKGSLALTVSNNTNNRYDFSEYQSTNAFLHIKNAKVICNRKMFNKKMAMAPLPPIPSN